MIITIAGLKGRMIIPAPGIHLFASLIAEAMINLNDNHHSKSSRDRISNPVSLNVVNRMSETMISHSGYPRNKWKGDRNKDNSPSSNRHVNLNAGKMQAASRIR
jgi:hypothetical protein